MMFDPADMLPLSDQHRSWISRFGRATDRLLNVLLFNGSSTWTVSQNMATRAERREPLGCFFCKMFDVLIQRGHCKLALDPTATIGILAELRGGALIGAAYAAILFAGWEVLHIFDW